MRIVLFFLVAGLISLIPTVSAFWPFPDPPPVEKGMNYDREQIGEHEYVWTSYPERIYDYTASDGKPVYVDYRLFQDSNVVQLETANSGSLVFDKNTCSYNFYNGGRVEPGNDPKIKGISWTVKGKEASASTWSSVNGINNAACSVAVVSDESTVTITGSKTNSAGTFQIKLDYSPGRGIKETMRAYNNNPAWNNHNIGFTETFEVPQVIHFGNNVYDLANYNQTVLDRDWIENNEAKLVRLSDKIFYDFGIGFDNLNDIKITWTGTVAKLSLNYLYPTQTVPFQTWFEVDPTFGYATATHYYISTTGASASCETTTGGTKSQAQNLWVLKRDTTQVTNSCNVSTPRWDISSIPDGATPTDVTVKYDVQSVSTPDDCQWNPMQFDPSGATADRQLFLDALNGTSFVASDSGCTTVANDKTIDLGTAADTSVRNFLTSDFWAVGIVPADHNRDGSGHEVLSDNSGTYLIQLQVTYSVSPVMYELKPFRSDGTTVIGSGWMIKGNGTNTETSVINSTGWAKSTDVSYLSPYNYTVKDALDSFVNNMTINKILAANQAQSGATKIYDVDCGAADTDFQVKANFTAYHTMTSTTPTCDANGDISFTTTDTARGIGPAANQTRDVIARIIDTAEYDWLPGKMTANGTQITGAYLTNVVNFTDVQIGNGYNTRVMDFVIFTDNVTSQPTALSATPASETRINLSWTAPANLHGDVVQSYRVWRDGVIIQNSTGSTATTYSDTLAGPGGTSRTYQVCAWNRIGCSPYSSTATAITYTATTGTVTLETGVVGDVAQLNATVTITAGSPSPVTVNQIKLYSNGTLVETRVEAESVAVPGSVTLDPLWYRMITGNLYQLMAVVTVTNSSGNITLNATSSETREYSPTYANALDSPSIQGDVNATVARFDDEDGVLLKVNRIGVSTGTTWQIECIAQTNAQARATINETQTWQGTWRNASSTGYFNTTWTDFVNSPAYITCFNEDKLFTFTSFTNSSLALFGIQIFDDSYGAMLGVPVGIFFLALAAGMANKRTAPTWIVVLLGMAGIMATIGFFTFTPIIWGLALVTGLLGLLVNQKVF